MPELVATELKPLSPLLDACGLIRWLLMVNPTRRATLEDVASHWWLNWGYTTRVGEQGAPSTANRELQTLSTVPV